MIGIRLVAEKLTQNLIEMTELHNHLLKISGELGKAVDLKKIDIKTAVNLNAMLSEAINYTRCCTELKDKEAPSFRDWLMVNCEPTRNTKLFKKGNKLLLNTELLEMYKKEYSL